MGLPQGDRLCRLNDIAIRQMKTLTSETRTRRVIEDAGTNRR
jgi:hypothetical protein